MHQHSSSLHSLSVSAGSHHMPCGMHTPSDAHQTSPPPISPAVFRKQPCSSRSSSTPPSSTLSAGGGGDGGLHKPRQRLAAHGRRVSQSPSAIIASVSGGRPESSQSSRNGTRQTRPGPPSSQSRRPPACTFRPRAAPTAARAAATAAGDGGDFGGDGGSVGGGDGGGRWAQSRCRSRSSPSPPTVERRQLGDANDAKARRRFEEDRRQVFHVHAAVRMESRGRRCAPYRSRARASTRDTGGSRARRARALPRRSLHERSAGSCRRRRRWSSARASRRRRANKREQVDVGACHPLNFIEEAAAVKRRSAAAATATAATAATAAATAVRAGSVPVTLPSRSAPYAPFQFSPSAPPIVTDVAGGERVGVIAGADVDRGFAHLVGSEFRRERDRSVLNRDRQHVVLAAAKGPFHQSAVGVEDREGGKVRVGGRRLHRH